MTGTLKAWIFGLVAAVVSAIADAGLVYLVAPEAMKDLKQMGMLLLFFGLKALFLYLKQSPLPKALTVDVATKATTVMLLVCLLGSTVGCDQTSYRKAAQAAATISTSLKAAQNANAQLYASGLLSKDETINVALAISDCTRANDQFVDNLRTLGKIDTANKGQILTWLNQVSASVERLNSTAVFGIKDQKAGEQFRLTIQALQSAVEIIRMAVTS